MLFTGRLTDDAKVRHVKNDKKVTGFTVAINQRYKTKEGEKREKSAYVVCSYWINPGIAEFLKKGTVVQITGWMEAQAWANRDGEPQATLICSVDKIELFGKPAEKQSDKPAEKKKKATAGATDEDDLPF
jgi:single-strand DNA-binding protein